MSNTNTVTIPEEYTVCFTGPRPKNIIPNAPYADTSRPEYQKIVDHVAALVEELIAAGMKRFITGGAQGFDQLAFWAVYRCKKNHPEIVNDIYIPFPGQELRWAKNGIFSQSEYVQMLQLADHVYSCKEIPLTTDFSTKISVFQIDTGEYIIIDPECADNTKYAYWIYDKTFNPIDKGLVDRNDLTGYTCAQVLNAAGIQYNNLTIIEYDEFTKRLYYVAAKALMYRNECMVNASATVIGKFNDDSWKTAKKGGTVACLKYASSQNRNIITRSFTDDNAGSDNPFEN